MKLRPQFPAILFSSPSLIKGSFLYNLVRKVLCTRQGLWARLGWSQPLFPWPENPNCTQKKQGNRMSCFSSDLFWHHQIYPKQINSGTFQWTNLVKSHALLTHVGISGLFDSKPTQLGAYLDISCAKKACGQKGVILKWLNMVKQTQKRIDKGKRQEKLASDLIALLPPV